MLVVIVLVFVLVTVVGLVLVTEVAQLTLPPRTAVRLDRRHYNAWYGIGLTYYKQVAELELFKTWLNTLITTSYV